MPRSKNSFNSKTPEHAESFPPPSLASSQLRLAPRPGTSPDSTRAHDSAAQQHRRRRERATSARTVDHRAPDYARGRFHSAHEVFAPQSQSVTPVRDPDQRPPPDGSAASAAEEHHDPPEQPASRRLRPPRSRARRSPSDNARCSFEGDRGVRSRLDWSWKRKPRHHAIRVLGWSRSTPTPFGPALLPSSNLRNRRPRATVITTASLIPRSVT
jgi:hypothetical protein